MFCSNHFNVSYHSTTNIINKALPNVEDTVPVVYFAKGVGIRCQTNLSNYKIYFHPCVWKVDSFSGWKICFVLRLFNWNENILYWLFANMKWKNVLWYPKFHLCKTRVSPKNGLGEKGRFDPVTRNKNISENLRNHFEAHNRFIDSLWLFVFWPHIKLLNLGDEKLLNLGDENVATMR